MAKVDELVINKEPVADQAKLKADIEKASVGSGQKALYNMAFFPLVMFVCYVLIWFYFRSKGGYKPVSLSDGQQL